MWSGTTNPHSKNLDRGGFQDRDVGRTQFDHDYGPEYGIDYARFSDTPNEEKDNELKSRILLSMDESFSNLEIKVRNGFVIVKGDLPDEKSKDDLRRKLKSLRDVVEVIWDVRLMTN